MAKRRRRSLIKSKRRGTSVSPYAHSTMPEAGEEVESEPQAPSPPNAVEAAPQDVDAAAELEPPPLPGGWPLEANLRPAGLAEASDPPPPPSPKPTPTKPTPVSATPTPIYAATRAMLRSHRRPPGPPEVTQLLTPQEIRLFFIALTVALSMIACGTGGLIGLLGILKV